MYQCFSPGDAKPKKSTKGIPHQNEFSQSLFEDVLFNRVGRQTIQLDTLRKDPNKKIIRTSTEKSSLSDIFVKMRVAPDGVSCSPLLTADGNYL